MTTTSTTLSSSDPLYFHPSDHPGLLLELDERYGQSNGAMLYKLQKEISSTSQGNLDIAGYYTKLKKSWDELNAILCLPDCTCGAAQALIKHDQDQKLIQFLMGLNSTYNTIRGNLLIMRPLPTLEQAYNLLIQEEKQRDIQPVSQIIPDHASLSVTKPSYGYYKGKPDAKKTLYCDHCKKPGHVVNKCYRLIGFPKDFKFTKGKNASANSANIEDSSEKQFNPNFCKQLLKLLSTVQSNGFSQDSNKSLSVSPDGFPQNSMVHSACSGPFHEEATGSW
ncbi:unnamed protein product [Cuscuta campestris]|uniref:Retrotransposon gag domain-containing protein n=1 Tax=Cuscuta campestris TaxID=132261 RepID=A0A484KT17_9ASTE|nr:unnamed protein product [Cuscuta campestris]